MLRIQGTFISKSFVLQVEFDGGKFTVFTLLFICPSCWKLNNLQPCKNELTNRAHITNVMYSFYDFNQTDSRIANKLEIVLFYVQAARR